MKSLNEIVRHMSGDGVLASTISGFLNANPESIPDFVASAIDHGALSAASAIFEHVSKSDPQYLDLGLRLVDALQDAADTEPALQLLARINLDRPGEAAVMVAMQLNLMRVATVCNDYIAVGKLDEALSLSNLIVDLWPQVEVFRSKREDIRLNLEFQALLAQADTHARERNFEIELKYRLILFDHPWHERQVGVFRLQNIVIALSRLLRADLDQMPRGRILAAQRLLSAVPEVPPFTINSGSPNERAVARVDRFYRQLLGMINLDVVFGEPKPLEPPWPLSFLSSTGLPMEPADVMRRREEIGAKIAFITSTSKEYFARYAQSYAASILHNSDIDCLVFICVCTQNMNLIQVVKDLQIQDPRLIFCSDGFDPEANPIEIYDPGRDEPHVNPGIYYASSGLLHADTIMSLLEIPIICTGIDTVLQGSVGNLREKFANYDLVLNQSGAEFLVGSQVINNLIMLYPTDNSFLFVDFLRKYLGFHLQQEQQAAFLDQLDLQMAKHHLMKNSASPKLGYFGEFDINNVMFERSHMRTHADLVKQFRFLNLFVGGGTANPLTPEDVIPK